MADDLQTRLRRLFPEETARGQATFKLFSLPEQGRTLLLADTDAALTAALAPAATAAAGSDLQGFDGWKMLFHGGVLEAEDPSLAEVPDKLLQAGYQHPQQVAAADPQKLSAVFAGNTYVASVVQNRCALYSGVMMTRAAVLATQLQDVLASSKASSSSQTDLNKGGHPADVKAWEGLNQLVKEHVASLTTTPAIFPGISMPSFKGSASEATCDIALAQSVLEPLNRLLRYRGIKEARAEMFQWQQQSTQTPTDSQEPQVEHRLAADAAQRVVDKGIKDAALRGVVSRSPVMVYEMKRLERLEPVGSLELDVVAVWNGTATTAANSMVANVVGAIAQVNRYASLHGCRFGAFGTYRYTWFVAFQPGNKVQVAGPYKHDCADPTLLQVLHYLSCQASEQEQLDPWEPLEKHPLGLGRQGGSGRGSRRSESGTPAPDAQGDSSSGSGLPAKRPWDATAAEGATCGSSDDQQHARDQLSGRGQVLAQHHAAASALSVAAAGLSHRAVQKIIGYGISGPVFLHKLSSSEGGTTAVALKLAPWPSERAHALAREGSVLLAIMALWDRCVPPLVALGRGQGGRSFMLATRYLQGRHLELKRDEHLAPQLALAVNELHSLGVAHCDLRPENVMVVLAGGQERVWLIDFGHAKQGADEAELQSDIAALAQLFQGPGKP